MLYLLKTDLVLADATNLVFVAALFLYLLITDDLVLHLVNT